MTKKPTTKVTISVKVKGKLSVTLTRREALELKEALDSALDVRTTELKGRLEEIIKKLEKHPTITSYPPIVVREHGTPIQTGTPWCGPNQFAPDPER